MKVLLTSSGITNTTIHNAQVDRLGKTDRRVQRALHSHRSTGYRCRRTRSTMTPQ
jgi:hypothetical protein